MHIARYELVPGLARTLLQYMLTYTDQVSNDPAVCADMKRNTLIGHPALAFSVIDLAPQRAHVNIHAGYEPQFLRFDKMQAPHDENTVCIYACSRDARMAAASAVGPENAGQT